MNSNKRARSWMEHWNCNLNIHKLKYRYIYIWSVYVYIYIYCKYCIHNSIHILYIYISYIYILFYRIYVYIPISNFKRPRSMCISTVACHINVKGNFYHQIAASSRCPRTNWNERNPWHRTNGFVWRFRGKHHNPVDYHQWIISFPSKMVVLGGTIIQF